MKHTLSYPVILCVFLVALVVPLSSNAENDLTWHNKWNNDLFAQAKLQDKFVILDLEALWCHWCHVMEETTYKNEKVVSLLKQKYITVRVDQDTNPDLLARYGDYGWPATIVFAADGTEIVKRRGYINPEGMASMLQAIIDDPSPGPSIFTQPSLQPSLTSALNPPQKKALLDRFIQLYDAENGGWGFIHKFINADAMDYALLRAHQGDRLYEIMARQTLHAALDLIDPEWGGVYQYSDRLDWQSPHFEKIMSIQTQYLRLYSLAWSLWKMDTHREAADSIYNYLNNFLKSPGGLYYTSQDADLNNEVDGHNYYPLEDSQRRQLGIPTIDKNIYTRDNAWIIRSFVSYATSIGSREPLQQALNIARQLESKYAADNGGFKHTHNAIDGPYLSDTLAMSRAYLSLYQATANREWLSKSSQSLQFIQSTFKDSREGGYMNSQVSPNAIGVFSKAVKQRDENIELARVANLAYQYSGDEQLLSIFDHAMKYMTSNAMLEGRFFLAGLLVANEEASKAPIHITIVGEKSDAVARQLHTEARRYPVEYLRVDWWDKSEGPPVNNDIQYPQLDYSAAFACSANSCSLPIVDINRLHSEVDRLLKPVAAAKSL